MIEQFTPTRSLSMDLHQTTMTEIEIIQRCITLRKKLNLTQQEMADKLGVSLSSWQSWESGKHRPIAILLREIERLEKEEVVSESITDKCARLRAYYGYTRAQMAEFFGCNPNTWGDWEAGKRKPNKEAKKKIEELLAEKEVA